MVLARVSWRPRKAKLGLGRVPGRHVSRSASDYLIGELHLSRNVEQFGTAGLPGETLHDPVIQVLAVCHLDQSPEDVHVELLL